MAKPLRLSHSGLVSGLKTAITLSFFSVMLATTALGQTVIFSNPGKTYNNTDMITTDIYNVGIGNCSSISFTMNFNFSLPWAGSSNMEANDECPFAPAPCDGDPATGSTGSCANCWDFLYVQYQIDGITVFSRLVGVPGDLVQSGTIDFGPICTQNAANASIIVQTQTWASDESITFSGLTVTCWDAMAMPAAAPNPVCAGLPFNLTGNLTNASSVGSVNWSGPGTIANPTAVNTSVSNAPVGNNTYVLTTTDDNSCTETSEVDVMVTAAPTADNPGPQSFCAGQAVNIPFTGTATTYNWTNSNPAIGLGASGTGDLDFNAAAVTAVTNATITVTPVENGCPGMPITFQITVGPGPTVNVINDVSECAGEFISVNFTGSGGGTIYEWINDNPAIGLAGAGTGNINFTSDNVTMQEVANITVTPTNAAGCDGTPRNFMITINPSATVQLPDDITVCSGDDIEIEFMGTAVNYSWISTNAGTGVPNSGVGNISVTTPTFYDLQEVTNVTVTPTGACPGSPETFTITVRPTSTVATVQNVSVCSGQPVTINFNSQPSNVLPTWFNDETAIGLGINGAGNISFNAANVTATTTGTITVQSILAFCSGPATSFNITVTPGPSMNNIANLTVCAGGAISAAFSGAGTGATYAWTNSNPAIGIPASGNGNITGTASMPATTQTATITVTPSLGGCTGPSRTFTITVNPPPVATAPANVAVCAGQPVAVNFTGTAGANFNWTNSNTAIGLSAASGSGNIAFNTPSALAATETATIAVTPQLGTCFGTPVNFTITANALPALAINTVLCAANLATYSVVVTSNAATLTASAGVVTPSAGGFTIDMIPAGTNVSLTATSAANCPSMATVNAPNCNCAPVTSAANPNNPVICEGATIPALSVTALPGLEVSWFSAASGGTALVTNSLTYTPPGPFTAGTYTFYAETKDPVSGCVSTTRTAVVLTVNTTPVVDAIPDQAFCAGEPVAINFTGTSGATFNWTNTNTGIGLGASGTGNITFNTQTSLATTQSGIISVTPQIGTCPGTIPANFTLTINALPSITIGAITCAPDLQSYSVAFTTNGTTASSSLGMLSGGAGSYTVSQIPAGMNTTLGAVSAAVCPSQAIVTAPNCNCPAVPIPTNPNNPTICAGGTTPALTVTTVAGLEVSWFSAATGGTALLVNNTAFTPTGVSAPGTYTFYAEAKDPVTGCISPNRTPVILTVNPTPVVDAPANVNVCAGTPVTVNFTGTTGATFDWTNSNTNIGLGASGTGNISFTPPANIANTQAANLSVVPTLGTCPGAAVNFTATINAIPIITIGTIACAPDLLTYSVALTATGGVVTATAGTVTGSGGTFSIVNIPIGTNITVTAATPNCQSQQSVNSPNCNCPTVNPPVNPSNPIICQGASIPALSVAVDPGLVVDWYLTASGGTAIITNASSITPPGGSFPPGMYTFYAEARDPATGCVSTTRTPVVLTINPSPTLTTPSSITVCAEQAIIVNFNGTASAVFNWVNNNTNIGLGGTGTGNISFTVSPDIEMTEVATIQVTPSLGNCPGTPVTFTITANPAPTLDLGNIQCDPGLTTYSIQLMSNATSLIATSGTVTNNAGNFTIANIPEGTNIVISATGANGCKNIQSVNSPNCNCPNLAPPANPNNPNLCQGGTIPALTVTVGSLYQVNWFAAATGGTALVSNTTSYTPSVANTPGTYTFYAETYDPATNCTSTIRTAVTLTISANPLAAISGLLKTCAGDPVVLTATGGSTYLWNNSNTAAAITVSPIVNTTYTVTVSNASLCTQSVTFTVTVNLPFNVNLNVSTCDPAQVGTVTQNLQTIQGCDSTVIINTTLDPANCAPSVTVTNGSVDCAGTANGTLTIMVSGGAAPYTYNWAGNSATGTGQVAQSGGTGLIQNLASGNYTITVTGSNGITVTATGSINTPTPVVAVLTVQSKVNGFGVSCNGSTDGVVNSNISGGTSPYTYLWSSGATTASASNLSAQTYTVTLTDNKGCSATASITLTAPPALSLEVSAQEANCGDTTAAVTVTPVGGSGLYTYRLDGISVQGPRINVSDGNHTILVTDNAGCTADTMVNAIVPDLVEISLPANQTVTLGSPVTINALTNLTSWQSLVWSPLRDTANANTLTQTWTPLLPEVIKVTIVDEFGCPGYAEMRILIRNDIGVYIPNVFEPGANGENGVWKIFGNSAVETLQKVHVFDRWGSSVYLWDEPIELAAWPGWDGYAKGEKLNPGVFVYYVTVKLLNGEEVLLEGDVTILR